MAKQRKTYSGKYPVKNKQKYTGDSTNVVYRSLWERRVMEYLDFSPIVLKWASEEKIIPYKSSTDGRVHRYFMDFEVIIKMGDGSIRKYLLEIKPKNQTEFPKEPKRKTKSYYQSIETYIKNQDKWKAATSYASLNNYVFKIITEDHLKTMSIF